MAKVLFVIGYTIAVFIGGFVSGNKNGKRVAAAAANVKAAFGGK